MESVQVIACSKVITFHMLQSRQPITVFNPHKGIVNCVHINHTNKVVASCGQDGRIVLTNALKPDNEVFETAFHGPQSTIKPAAVNCIMFSSHSHYIAAGSADCLVKIWDMKNHKHVYSTIKSHVASVTSLAWIKNFSQEKQKSQLGEVLVSASSIGDIFLHSVKTGNIVQNLNTKNQQAINQIKVSQSEGHCRLAACTASGSVMVWNMRNLEKDSAPLCYFNNGKKSSITSVSFSSFNPVLLSASSMDETLTFYDVNEKKSVKVITAEQPLTSINFHSDGHTLLAGGMYGGLFVYDLRKPSKPRQKLTGHDSAIKHSVLIKEYQPSSAMSQSRTSKSSSVNSFGSKAPSTRSGRDTQEPRLTKLNNFVQGNNQGRKTETIGTSNDKDIGKTSSLQAIEQGIKRQSGTVKLSTTAQEAIKNAETKSISSSKVSNSSNSVSNLPSSLQPSSQSSYTYQTKPIQPTSTLISSNKQLGLNKPPQPSSSLTRPPLQKPSTTTLIPSSPGRQISGKQITQLKSLIQQRFQNLHLELIHQFHMQQKQMKEIITTLLIQDKKKNNRIKELQAQVQKLKWNTY